MNTNTELLEDSLSELKIEWSDEMIDKFNAYYDLLIEWNNKINLTTITEYDDVVLKHFIDSVLICTFTDLSNKRVIDVGTGAGFPGIPLKILNPDCEIFLIDSLNKRVKFLECVSQELKFNNIKILHGRAEDLAKNETIRSSFDYSVSRAVANLSTLCEYCIPFLKRGGSFISYKSDKSDIEIESAENAIKILGSKIDRIEERKLPGTDIKRKLVVIKNIKEISDKYPRKAGIPAKEPL